MTQTARTADRPLLGITLMLGFCALAPMSDALAKILGDEIPLLQLILVRFGAQAVMFVPLALAMGVVLFPSARVLSLTLLRTIFHIAGIGLMFTALRFLPIADAVAIAFVMPFILLILGKLFLAEEVGARRMIACAVGFCGTLMVVQPSFVAVGWPAILPLLVAFVFAIFMLITRAMAKDIEPVAMQGLSALVALPILLPMLAMPPGLGNPPPFAWVAATDNTLWLLLALGVTGAFAHLLMSASLRFAQASALAPMQYLEIPVATFVGWLIFQELPNGLAALGICLTIAAGLYVIARERAIGLAQARAASTKAAVAQDPRTPAA
ncbi:MAG: DMT family transporter [Pseudomonadota bacterium]